MDTKNYDNKRLIKALSNFCSVSTSFSLTKSLLYQLYGLIKNQNVFALDGRLQFFILETKYFESGTMKMSL